MISIYNDINVDLYTVGVMKEREVVGNVPCEILKMCAVFKTGQYIKCTIAKNCHFSHDLLHKYSQDSINIMYFSIL